MEENSTDNVKSKIRSYSKGDIHFTKKNVGLLEERNHRSVGEMKDELISAKHLYYAIRQEIIHAGSKEVRHRCYFVYSASKGRCYIINLNSYLKVITVFPLGRKTLKKYKLK